MDVARAICPECQKPLAMRRMECPDCRVSLEGEFELSPLAKLSPDDQAFVIAFLRHHGSIKKMETVFDISYPTVKNRLNAIAAALDKNFEAPTPNLYVLEQLKLHSKKKQKLTYSVNKLFYVVD